MCKECHCCLTDEQKKELSKLGFTRKEIEKMNYYEDELRIILKV